MNTIFFHEDDYCQIELLPFENLGFCLNEVAKISEFSEKHKAGIGWTDIYIRNTAPKKLAECKIDQLTFEKTFSTIFTKTSEVFTGYGSEYREKCDNIYAFGESENVVMFYDVKDDFIENIWFTLDICNNNDIESAKKIFELLSSLGEYILADWSWHFIEKIDNKESITDYLNKRLDTFFQVSITKHIYFSDIKKISPEGILFNYCGDKCFLNFEKCIDFFNKKNDNVKNCIALVQAKSTPPYIIFYSDDIILQVSFYKERLFKKLDTNDNKGFARLCKKIKSFGYQFVK